MIVLCEEKILFFSILEHFSHFSRYLSYYVLSSQSGGNFSLILPCQNFDKYPFDRKTTLKWPFVHRKMVTF